MIDFAELTELQQQVQALEEEHGNFEIFPSAYGIEKEAVMESARLTSMVLDRHNLRGVGRDSVLYALAMSFGIHIGKQLAQRDE